MTTVALLGCGKMGSALLRGWVESGGGMDIHVVEPSELPDEFQRISYIHDYKDVSTLPACGIYVMAVKPQIMDTVCAALRPSGDALILSIAAGRTIASFTKHFSERQPVIRAMPNTPAAIGKGITAAVANTHVRPLQKDMAMQLLRSTGQLEWLDDEGLMDAITAVSGSGPAYIFLMIEALAAAGEKAGLPKALATALARQTVIGAAALAEADAGTDAITLRRNVTSPGGTTEAALNVLMRDNGLQPLMDEAILAAKRRGKELAE